MKRLIKVIPLLLMLFLLVSCGKEDNNNNNEGSNSDKPADKTYEVSFNTFGGSSISSLELKEDESFDVTVIDNPTKDNYTFKYWSLDEKGSNRINDKIVMKENIKIFANYEINKYNLVLKDQNDEVIENKSLTYKDVFNYNYKTPQSNEYVYKFKGYSLDIKGTNCLKNIPKISKDETYYIIFDKEIRKYEISFDTLGGTTISNLLIPYSKNLEEPIKPTKEGFRFVNWVYDTSSMEVVSFPLKITKDLKIYATYNEEIIIKEHLQSMLDSFSLNPYSYIPETLRKEENITTYNQNSYNNFTNINDITYGFGEQWNMVLNNLDQSEMFFNTLGVIEGLSSTSIALFNNYIDSNPNDVNNFEFMQGLYSVAINYSDDVLSYNLSYDTNIPLIGNIKANITITYNTITLNRTGKISLGEANALKYEMTDNSYTFAIKYLGVRRAYFEISKDINDNVNGSIFEFLEIQGKGINSSVQFGIKDNYLSVVGNKASGLIVFYNVINELYDINTGKLIGYEIRETLRNITYNTLWFNLSDVHNIFNIKKVTTNDSEDIYVNNSLINFENKNVGGFSLKSLSRRFDIVFRKQYIYVIEEGKTVEKEISVPMLFIQQEQLENFSKDITEQNDYLSNVSINLKAKDIDKIILDYETLIDIFISNKENITSDDIINYID